MAKISFYDVAQQCNKLQLLGEKPSVRKLRAVLGGSFTTINEYLRQWREEQSLAGTSEFEISKELQDVIQSEFVRIAKEVQSSMQGTLEEKTADLEDALKEIKELNGKNFNLEIKIAETNKHYEQHRIESDKKLAILEAEISYLKNEKEMLHKKLGEANKAKHDAEISAVEAKARLDEIKKQMKKKETE
ncbi:replication region DNA-binding N-term [Legionella quinlivanii DSM 21216]|uniref:DNA-binding protein n=1 Tax=Legionella quinlivanii TaxID=45073 RepID=UPI00089E766C|nr:DNA-binding protein [Legionella quinlivanii]SEG40461.1 replication region DNA-binding N-term [Legionella quinlivanii DSM 21216]